MQPYGKTKRGSGKIHGHASCMICSENKFNKKSARQKAKKSIAKELEKINIFWITKDMEKIHPKVKDFDKFIISEEETE